MNQTSEAASVDSSVNQWKVDAQWFCFNGRPERTRQESLSHPESCARTSAMIVHTVLQVLTVLDRNGQRFFRPQRQ